MIGQTVMAQATQTCIENFVTDILGYSPRKISYYEKCAVAYALYTILRDNELLWNPSINSRFTETPDIYKDMPAYEFHMFGQRIDGLNINEFFDLAKSIEEFLCGDDWEIREALEKQCGSSFFIFFKLIELFIEWEKMYALEMQE